MPISRKQFDEGLDEVGVRIQKYLAEHPDKAFEPDEVAEVAINGMRRRDFLIIPGFEGKFVYLIKRLFPWLAELIQDRAIENVRKRKV